MADFKTNQWAAIEQEVRRCFIQEDAPEHLASLEQNLLQLDRIGGSTPDTKTSQWHELARSIHTLKGSAGLSQLHNLSTLAHRLEDVLLALGDRRLSDPGLGTEVLLLGVDEMRQQLRYIAEHDRECEPSILIENIDLLLSQSGLSTEETPAPGSSEFNLVATVLEADFKNCLQRTHHMVDAPPSESVNPIEKSLNLLIQDCRTLGEILQLDWLLNAIPALETIVATAPDQQLALVKDELEKLEILRLETLKQHRSTENTTVTTIPDTPAKLAIPTIAPVNDTSPAPVTVPIPINLPTTPPSPPVAPIVAETTMRVPVRQLDNLANTVGDLLIQSERLGLDQRRLRQASQGLKKQTRQFYQLRERIQNCYDQLLLPGLRSSRRFQPLRSSHLINENSLPGHSASGAPRSGSAALLTPEDFDPLELDRFTDLHTLLQDLQEFLARIDEYADDLDLGVQSAQDSRDRLNQELGSLRQNLTSTRMVSFSTLADRFRRPLWDLNQRYNKQVKLLVKGGEVEIDRAVLDALYDPLLHLIRNAFDHGQESPAVRKKQGKPAQGKVMLKAEQSGTIVVITVTDDGRGIDLEKVRTLAESKGLLNVPQPTTAQILNCLFAPGFSTADRVGELSGRGVGLDVVKTQLEQLRGSVQVQTRPGQGTRFTLRVPSTLNILPLLLCQQQRSGGAPVQVALPSSQVLELVELSPTDIAQKSLVWRGQSLPLLSLTTLIPPSSYPWQIQSRFSATPVMSVRSDRMFRTPGMAFATALEGGIAIVLHSTVEPVALQVDMLLEEREMVLKPIDSWLPLPSYIGGCTVLPQGEVVPVFSPEALSQTIGEIPLSPSPTLPPPSSAALTILIVDDSAAARRWLAHALQPLGYEVIQCRDGQEAWEQLQSGSPCHLMVCDVEMPRLDGFQLLHQVRQDAQWQKLPVAMLTSRQSDRHRQQAKQLGATGYFVKPLGIQELVRTIETFLPTP